MLRSCLRIVAFAILCGAATLSFAQGQLRLFPDSPVAGEDFMIVFEGTVGWTPAIVTGSSIEVQSDNQIFFSINVGGGETSSDASDFRAMQAVNLAPGTYQLTVRVFGTFTWFVVRTLVIPPPPPTISPQFRTLTGLWWLPSESGSALNLTQSNETGKLFALWYTYLPDQSASVTANTWYNMSSGRWTSPTEWRGLLYTATGPRLNGTFAPGLVGLQPVGLMTIRAASPDSITMDAQVFPASVPPIPQISKTTTLQRYAF
jgi:hypothetical protein